MDKQLTVGYPYPAYATLRELLKGEGVPEEAALEMIQENAQWGAMLQLDRLINDAALRTEVVRARKTPLRS